MRKNETSNLSEYNMPASVLTRLIDRISSSRTAATRKFAFLLAGLLLVTDHSWSKTGFLDVFLGTTGLVLVGIGAMGRAWASMYISGYKDKDLVTEGAYSIVRNPLYVFSFIGAVGVGCATGSLLLIGLLILGFFIYYPLTMTDEAQRLAAKHGQECGITGHVRGPVAELIDQTLAGSQRSGCIPIDLLVRVLVDR